MRFVCRYAVLCAVFLCISTAPSAAQLVQAAPPDTALAATPDGWRTAEILRTNPVPLRISAPRPLPLHRGLAATSLSAAGAFAGGLLGYFAHLPCYTDAAFPEDSGLGDVFASCVFSFTIPTMGASLGNLLLPSPVRQRTATAIFFGGLASVVPLVAVARTSSPQDDRQGFTWKQFQILGVGPVLGMSLGWVISKRGITLRLVSPRPTLLPDLGQRQRLGLRGGLQLQW